MTVEKILQIADETIPQWRNNKRDNISVYCRYLVSQELIKLGLNQTMTAKVMGLKQQVVLFLCSHRYHPMVHIPLRDAFFNKIQSEIEIKMKKLDDDKFILSDGTVFRAHRQLLSLGEDLRLYHGYDGAVECENFVEEGDCRLYFQDDFTCEFDQFTQSQREEIADYMIDKWTKFKNRKDE